MELYAGLACLKANPNCKDFRRFGNRNRPLCACFRLGQLREAYSKRVQTITEELDCILVDLEEVELLEIKMDSGDFPEEFFEMRNTAVRQPKMLFLEPSTSGMRDEVN